MTDTINILELHKSGKWHKVYMVYCDWRGEKINESLDAQFVYPHEAVAYAQQKKLDYYAQMNSGIRCTHPDRIEIR